MARAVVPAELDEVVTGWDIVEAELPAEHTDEKLPKRGIRDMVTPVKASGPGARKRPVHQR